LKINKTIYATNDIILTNFYNKVVIDLSHPDFIRDFYSNEHLYTYPKVTFFTSNLIRVMGKGIPFSEGNEWKRKRRIINAVFNFEFVKAMTGKIEKVCEKAMKDVENVAVHT
jgi:cytochrome P450